MSAGQLLWGGIQATAQSDFLAHKSLMPLACQSRMRHPRKKKKTLLCSKADASLASFSSTGNATGKNKKEKTGSAHLFRRPCLVNACYVFQAD